jgi:iron(III)-enterobactin esterase
MTHVRLLCTNHSAFVLAVLALPLACPRGHAQQFVLFDATFTFTKEDADNSKPSKSHYYVRGKMLNTDRPKDWVKPVDYRNGTVHIRAEVIEKPAGGAPTTWTLCYIPNKGQKAGYGCTGTEVYKEKGVYERDVKMTSFWQNDNIVWEEGIKEMHLVMKDDSGGSGHAHKRTDPEKFFPTKMRITMIQVAKGSTYDPKLVPNLPAKDDSKPGKAAGDQWADGDFTIGPPYTNAPELTVKDGVPRGVVTQFVMNSEDSKVYPGIAKRQPGVVPYKRKVWVYVPKQYVPGTAAPFVIAQDGGGYVKTLIPALDTLIHEKRIPVIAAILIDSGGGDAQGSQRGLEYDTVSDVYTGFVETEVLPRAAKEAGVKFTTDPDGRATMGGSSGGACAFTMAWFRPDLYHRVLTYSGTYVNQQSPVNPKSPHGAWEYHENLIPKSDAKPLRVWLEVSENDNGSKRDEASLHNWVMANQRMAAALKAKGYHYRYVFAKGAGHTDGKVTRQTLPEALEWLWRGYKKQ